MSLNKYRLVAVDCDRTLLDRYGNICDTNKEIIRRLRDKGVDFIIATGRNDVLAREYAEELELDAPIIGCNGATVSDFSLGDDRFLFVNAINDAAVARVIDYFEENKLFFKLMTTDCCYTNDEEAMRLRISQIVKEYTHVLKYDFPYHFCNSIGELRGIKNVLKVSFINDDDALRMKVHDELQGIDGLNVHAAGFNCIDIIAVGSTKGEALQAYAEKKGIKREEIIAFGDGENDISMIEYAGIGAAMINGDEKLKKAADVITKYDNTNGGVGLTLAEIFGEEL